MENDPMVLKGVESMPKAKDLVEKACKMPNRMHDTVATPAGTLAAAQKVPLSNRMHDTVAAPAATSAPAAQKLPLSNRMHDTVATPTAPSAPAAKGVPPPNRMHDTDERIVATTAATWARPGRFERLRRAQP